MNEQQQRETKEITVAGHTMTVLTYINGYDERAVQEAILKTLELNESGKADVSKMNGSMILIQRDKYAELIVKTLDGSSEDILNRILILPSKESSAIMTIVSDIATGKETANSEELSASTSTVS